MKNDLIWGWVFVGLALLMVVLIIYACFISNWAAIPMCSFALILNVGNAISRFTSYNRYKDYHKMLDKLDTAILACWPDKEDNCIE